ncbi:hypothetical protein SAMN05877838_3894 [Hoeflea halophila]|uniref:Carbohydrate kinase PfkB domain-containing protein n=1 Tax=Hoeflea halophila TaxID=714899 RepID=A0A286IH18_9HYPH|nr:PfkB family carbohydrate kinase [Hoeflea halophila]SOE18946.1 hypothetical protein SAMN05877838_3894 [Hoeflea halophila]
MSATTIVSVGEIHVEFVSHAKGCALSELASYTGPYPAGAAATCLDQAARMGARTKIFGGLGEDGFGCAMVERLADSGVETSGIALHDDRPTGVAFVSEFEDGSRSVISHVNSSAAEAVGKVVTGLPDADLLLHVSGASLGNAKLRTAILNACDEVVARSGRISCDLRLDADLMGNAKAIEALRRVLASSSIVFTGNGELGLLYPGKSEAEAVAALRAAGAHIIVFKPGEHGLVILDSNTRHDFPVHDVERVDPSGMGDCFCGAFLAMMTQGHSVETAGRYANAAAALSAGKRGPMEGNASPQEIETLLARHQTERMRA